MKKLERETGKNYVFEQATLDKKKTSYSHSVLSMNIGSPQPLKTPVKAIMNQTVSGGF
jgi:hypothetical protein